MRARFEERVRAAVRVKLGVNAGAESSIVIVLVI